MPAVDDAQRLPNFFVSEFLLDFLTLLICESQVLNAHLNLLTCSYRAP